MQEHDVSSVAVERLRSRSDHAPGDRIKAVLIGSFGESLVAFRGDLIEDLLARGMSLLVLVPGLPDETKAWLTARGVRYQELPLSRTGTNPAEDLRYLAWLFEVLREEAPDLVVAYAIKPIVYGIPASRLAGVRKRVALVTGAGYVFTGGGLRRELLGGLARALYAVALRNATTVFFQNPDDRDFFVRARLVPGQGATHVLNGSGVDTRRFQPEPLPAGPVVFLLIARLIGDKGVREYVRAVRALRARHANFVARLVGWIDDHPEAIAQAELDEWTADGTIEFLGRLSDVRPALAACSVYVLPSYREGTPRTVLEALSMGRPVVTTDTPGCRETVVQGHNGYLVPVRSSEGLAEAMERFLVDPSLAGRMGARSRELAETKYDVHRVNAEMIHVMGIE